MSLMPQPHILTFWLFMLKDIEHCIFKLCCHPNRYLTCHSHIYLTPFPACQSGSHPCNQQHCLVGVQIIDATTTDTRFHSRHIFGKLIDAVSNTIFFHVAWYQPCYSSDSLCLLIVSCVHIWSSSATYSVMKQLTWHSGVPYLSMSISSTLTTCH